MILKQVIRYDNAPALEATWVDENDVVVKCQAYSNEQMTLLAADLGDDAPTYQALMDEIAATYDPPPPPSREELKTRVNAIRDQKETEGFVFGGKLFESDERSVARISNAALTAQSALATGQPFIIDWVAADNTTMQLFGSAMLEFQAALTARAGALHAYARLLKLRITNATTDEEANAIDIYSGWPNE